MQGTYVEKYIQWVYKLQRCRRQYGCIFIRLGLAASQICEIPRNSPKIRTESSSRSLQGHRSWCQKCQSKAHNSTSYAISD